MKQSQSKALLLMNVGSPDDPSNSSVKKYLTEFLNDKRVVDLPFVLRKLLVNAIIIPFRVKKSTVLYRQLWTDKGSPLIYHSMDLKEKLQKKTDNQYDIFLGMRYGNPSYKTAIAQIKAKGYKEMIVLPLFPQFAMSTIETAIEAVKKEVKKQQC
ncbi:MAG: ferrochelatase, partial [Clostridiales bacterium]